MPPKLCDQLCNYLLGDGILSAVHHSRLDIVSRGGRILEVLKAIDREHLDNLGTRNECLHHLRTGLDVIQSMAEIGDNRVSAVNENVPLNLISHSS